MTLAVFELNDSALGHGSSNDNWRYSPGFAQLADGHIVTGEAARSQAWLNPQHNFQQYWHQLNMIPLAVHTNSARHHADLAYAQLQQLHRDSGEPEEVILAVPGSFNNDQLSLLLGLVQALPFDAVGLVDSAVAATSTMPPSGPAIHLDIQQHQSLITRLHSHNGIRRETVEVVSNLGAKQFLDLWAHQIANQFIHQYRYDPLHTAEGEQQLYNQLPQWLDSLNNEPQVAVSLHSAKGEFTLNLMRDQLLSAAESPLNQLQKAIAEQRSNGEQLYISHRAALIPGLQHRLNTHQVLAENAVLQGCLNYRQQICSNSDSLHYIDTLHCIDTLAVAAAATPPQQSGHHTPATHVLVGHRALAIGEQLALRISHQEVTPCHPEQADLVLLSNGANITLQDKPAGVKAPAHLQAGAVIELQQHRLQLITVE